MSPSFHSLHHHLLPSASRLVSCLSCFLASLSLCFSVALKSGHAMFSSLFPSPVNLLQEMLFLIIVADRFRSDNNNKIQEGNCIQNMLQKSRASFSYRLTCEQEKERERQVLLLNLSSRQQHTRHGICSDRDKHNTLLSFFSRLWTNRSIEKKQQADTNIDKE